MSTTHPGAGVATLLAHAGLVSWTLSIDHTLWLALYVGVAYVVSNASTGGSIVPLSTLGIDAAG